jgi:hypothetical protein
MIALDESTRPIVLAHPASTGEGNGNGRVGAAKQKLSMTWAVLSGGKALKAPPWWGWVGNLKYPAKSLQCGEVTAELHSVRQGVRKNSSYMYTRQL